MDIGIQIGAAGIQNIPPADAEAATDQKSQDNTPAGLTRCPITGHHQEDEEEENGEHADESDTLALLDGDFVLVDAGRCLGVDVGGVRESARYFRCAQRLCD